MTIRGVKYLKQASLGFVGLALTVLPPVVLNMPGTFKVFNTANNLQTQAAIEGEQIRQKETVKRKRDEQRRESADAMRDGDIMPTHDTLRIANYRFNPKRDPSPDTTPYQNGETIIVYDKLGKCVGRIKDGEWQFKPHYQENICSVDKNQS